MTQTCGGTTGADTDSCRLTRAPTWRDGLCWAKCDGPTIEDRGAYYAHCTMQRLKKLSPFICEIFASFLPRGANVILMFLSDVAARDPLDQSAWKIAHLSGGSRSTRS